jgi:hypothetical protein
MTGDVDRPPDLVVSVRDIVNALPTCLHAEFGRVFAQRLEEHVGGHLDYRDVREIAEEVANALRRLQ